MHCRLIYRSEASEEIVSNEELRLISDASSTNNRAKGITGLLLYTGREFLQVLEGPEVEVNALFQKISRDERHHGVRIMLFEQTDSAFFEEWNMRLVDLYDLPGERRKIFLEKYAQEDGVIEIPERFHEVYALLVDAKTVCAGAPED